MAATATTDAHAELISSLSQDEIPIKLRCAICSRLAVNAFRLPCCEQAICETCQSTLPSSCPVCEHTPVAAEDCKPNKSLRTTIKVFLRTEEKKREALRSKEAKNSPPPTPLEVVETPVETPTPVDATEPKPEPSSIPAQDNVENPPETATEAPHDAEQQDIPQPSIEEITPGQEPSDDIAEKEANEVAVIERENEQIAEKDANGGAVSAQMTGMGPGVGFDASAAGNFPAMGFGGDFNQMQMMMAMQNGGMGANAFGSFPMMGMPGMGMDPMAMQNMFLNGGFGAGMNGMNMSMGAGMGGFDGGVGAGFNNEWNGQQSWNVGPDNFNHPNAAGMGTGDYGSNNSGYNSHASRYNQGNYGHGNQYNDYSSYGYQSRGRGRGRGGYGRGGYAQHYPQQFGSGEGFNGPNNETGAIPTGPKAGAASGAASNVDEFGREIRQTSEVKNKASAEPTSKGDTEVVPGQDHTGTDINQDSTAQNAPSYTDDDAPRPIQTLDEAEGYGQNGYNGLYNPGMSRGFPGRGGYNPTAQPVKPADVPINAPTGPKAMRDGLPNTGISGLRVRGYQAPGIPNSRTTDSVSAPPEPVPSEKNEKDGQRSRSPSREKSGEREKERPGSRDRRRSRSRDRRHRKQRHRSGSVSEDDKESERRRERRRERHRRREEEGDNGEDTGSREQQVDDQGREVEDGKSRSASPSDSRRSSHRSRRDRDKYRERERDKENDRDYKSSSHKHRTSNRHRDDRSRSRERDREHRHRHSRRGSEDIDDKLEKPDRSIPPTPIDAEDPSGRPLAATNGAIEIKGTSSRGKPTLDEITIPTGPRQDRISSAREREKDYDRGKENRDSRRHRDEDDARYRSSRHRESDRDREKERERAKEKDREKDRARAPPTAPAVQDPHTLEREARNRERLLKEAQRIAGLTGMAGAKRSREDAEDSRKGRKKGRRGEDSDEARMARLEAEREGARWN